jgi:hypothetical protein
MNWRDLPDGLPPLPDDVMPDFERDEDGDDGYDGTDYVELLRQAHWHMKESTRRIQKALDALDDEKARRERAAKLDVARRSLKCAIAANH